MAEGWFNLHLVLPLMLGAGDVALWIILFEQVALPQSMTQSSISCFPFIINMHILVADVMHANGRWRWRFPELQHALTAALEAPVKVVRNMS